MPMDRNRYSSYINAPKSMMGGPSMDTASLAQSLAQQLMGSSPAMGGIGASTGPMSVLGGPAGAVMGIPMKVLSRLSEQSQNAINAFTGMPNPLRKDPMRELDAMLQQYRQVPSTALSTGTIGTQNNITPDMDEQTFSMPKMSSEESAGAPSADNVYRFSGDEMPIELTDADIPPSAARSAVNRMVAASPMASARPVGGFNRPMFSLDEPSLGKKGYLAQQLASATTPPDRSMRQAGQYRPEASATINPSLTSAASIPTPRLSPTPTAASYMGTRAQPVLPPQQSAVMDIMQESDTMKKQRRPAYDGSGGGFGPMR